MPLCHDAALFFMPMSLITFTLCAAALRHMPLLLRHYYAQRLRLIFALYIFMRVFRYDYFRSLRCCHACRLDYAFRYAFSSI